MKSIFRKILGKNKVVEESRETQESLPIEDLYSLNPSVPIDEKFANKFTNTGGRFIYCIDEEEVVSSISNIIEENDWEEVLSLEENNNILLDKSGVPYSDVVDSNSVMFASCEALIAEEGSILVSSNQLKGQSLSELPYNFIIIARVKDIMIDKSEGLRCISRTHGRNIPSGITTVKGPKAVTGENNILDSGSINTSKNIYLLLTE